MAYADRIKDTIAVAGGGTGTITLTGTPPATYRALSNIGATGTTFDYVMEDGTNWEIGVGTTGATANTFTRAVTFSSNSNTAVNFAAAANFFITASATSITALLSATGTQTVTNKRVTARSVNIGTPVSAGLPAINTDACDEYRITALAAAITSFTTNLTGTPNQGDCLTLEITDNGTIRGLAWGSKFESSTIVLPTTTVASALLTISLKWNSAAAGGGKWRCIGVA